MSSFTYHFVSGDAFFSGTVLILLGCLTPLFKSTRPFPKTRRLLVLLGIILVALSSVPLPLWSLAVWTITLIGWLILDASTRNTKTQRITTALNITSIFLSFMFMTSEISFLLNQPPKHIFNANIVYVIGDSISAGTGQPNEVPWPILLTEKYGIPCNNLAEAGATLNSALTQATKVPTFNTIVILEIGGNDLLDGTPPIQFSEDLEKLIQTFHYPQRRLFMLELPLPPLYNEYGRIQRQLARKYDIALIPKRYFAQVLASEGATIDSLHLSKLGHEQMAEMIHSSIADCLHPKMISRTK